jgi:hypothetical protein
MFPAKKCVFVSLLILLYVQTSISAGADERGTDLGPTIYLDYSNNSHMKNPIYDFMYFVPMVSLTLVESVSSDDNTQQVGIISCKRLVDDDSFQATIEFRMAGKGSHKNTYDPEDMIADNVEHIEKPEPLKNMLDYITFEGESYGTVEIKGVRSGPVELATEVRVNFNARGHKSPVTIGIYDVRCVNGKYKYENRHNKTIVRVDSLTFRRTAGSTKMDVELASLYNFQDSENLWAILKGKIITLFLPPIRIDDLGNDVMLDFGLALYKGKTEFTFPKARKLKPASHP